MATGTEPPEVKITGQVLSGIIAGVWDQGTIALSGSLSWSRVEKPPKHIAVILWAGSPQRTLTSSNATWGQITEVKATKQAGEASWVGELTANYVGDQKYHLEVIPMDEYFGRYKKHGGDQIVNWVKEIAIIGNQGRAE